MSDNLGVHILVGTLTTEAYTVSTLWEDLPDGSVSEFSAQLQYHIGQLGFNFESVLACYIETFRFKLGVILQVKDMGYSQSASLLFSSGHAFITNTSLMLQLKAEEGVPEELREDQINMVSSGTQAILDALTVEAQDSIPEEGTEGDIEQLGNLILSKVLECSEFCKKTSDKIDTLAI